MEENKTTVNGNQTAVSETAVIAPTATVEELEARLKAIEIEKENYKQGLIKEKAKNKGENLDPNETEEDRIARIVDGKLAEKKLTALDTEKDALVQKLVKENKELKLAQLNKPQISTAMGTHSESQAVKDTIITPEQLAAFKAKGWTDKDIERYKKNLSKKV